MRITTLYAGSYAANTYLVTDDRESGAILIDPAISPETVRLRLGEIPRIGTILLTHGHFDHVLTLAEWRALTGAEVAMHRDDAPMLTSSYLSCYRYFLGQDVTFAPAERLLDEGDAVLVGSETLTVLSTPGHTPGSASYDSGEVLFTGDTLFGGGGYGRTDLPGGDTALLRASLSRLLALTGERRILPGHGEETTLSAAKNMFYNLL